MAADRAQPGPEIDHDELLEGWKAIADHLDKTERTVQRWEKTKGLPVRRLKSGSPEEMSRVFAYKSELDAWWKDRLTKPDDDDSNPNLDVRDPTPDSKRFAEVDKHHDKSPPSLSFWVAVALGVVLVAVGIRFGPDILRTLRPLPGRITLAVRPFKNLSGDPDEDFIGAGFTEEMVTRLGQLHPQAMGVVRLSPAYANATPERLGKDILADYILEGSVRRVGDQVAISAQLVQVSNQTVSWGESFDRDVKDGRKPERGEVGIRQSKGQGGRVCDSPRAMRTAGGVRRQGLAHIPSAKFAKAGSSALPLLPHYRPKSTT